MHIHVSSHECRTQLKQLGITVINYNCFFDVVSRKDKIPNHVGREELVVWERSTQFYTVAVSNEEVTQILKCQVIKKS
jgi:hypothetical protein